MAGIVVGCGVLGDAVVLDLLDLAALDLLDLEDDLDLLDFELVCFLSCFLLFLTLLVLLVPLVCFRLGVPISNRFVLNSLSDGESSGMNESLESNLFCNGSRC